jgi:hypothetical protein
MARIDVQSLNSSLGIVIFDDGVEGRITNWFTKGGVVHSTYQPDAYAVVAEHPEPESNSSWFAIDLSKFEPVIIP